LQHSKHTSHFTGIKALTEGKGWLDFVDPTQI
jgi:hypothetical protein